MSVSTMKARGLVDAAGYVLDVTNLINTAEAYAYVGHREPIDTVRKTFIVAQSLDGEEHLLCTQRGWDRYVFLREDDEGRPMQIVATLYNTTAPRARLVSEMLQVANGA